MGLLFGLVGLIGVGAFVLWIWALVDAIQRPDSQWEQAGQNKLIWIVLLIFVHFIGALLYLLLARPQLEEAARG